MAVKESFRNTRSISRCYNRLNSRLSKMIHSSNHQRMYVLFAVWKYKQRKLSKDHIGCVKGDQWSSVDSIPTFFRENLGFPIDCLE